MKIGMRVKCVDDRDTGVHTFVQNWPITKNKIYIVKDLDEGSIYVISDNGELKGYCSYRFREATFLNSNIKVI